MIISCKQTSLNEGAEFEFVQDGAVLRRGSGTRVLRVQRAYLRAQDGSPILTLSWDALTTVKNLVPGKWIFDDKLSKISYLRMPDDRIIGRVYQIQERQKLLTTYYQLQCDGEPWNIYKKSKGDKVYLSVFAGETQIAAITRLNTVIDGLDRYTLFVSDAYQGGADLLMAFTLYFDNQNYGNQMELKGSSMQTSTSYTLSATDKFVDPSWIDRNFAGANLDAVYAEEEAIKQEAKARIRGKFSW